MITRTVYSVTPEALDRKVELARFTMDGDVVRAAFKSQWFQRQVERGIRGVTMDAGPAFIRSLDEAFRLSSTIVVEKE